MYALDFQYDGNKLSDFGFIICNFDGSSVNTVNIGSVITFNKIPMHNGKIFSLTSTQYDECIQATFDICKNPKKHKDNMEITNEEYRNILRWLNRRQFLQFNFIYDDNDNIATCFYESSFNIDKITIDEKIYGLKLYMETNKPFGYGAKQNVIWNVINSGDTYDFSDLSDEIGSTYISLKISISQNGNFILFNEFENCTVEIKNCSAGEIIYIDGNSQIITTSLNSHHIYNDFNFEFFRIGNTFLNRINKISCSLPCSIEFIYSPIIKGNF